MVPRASPGPPQGLPAASLGSAEAILENMQRDTKKQEKQKGSPDSIFQTNVKFTDPGWTPKSHRSGPESEKKVKNDALFDATVGVTVLAGFFHRFSIDVSCVFRCVCSRIVRQFRKTEKCLKHYRYRYELKVGTIKKDKKR